MNNTEKNPAVGCALERRVGRYGEYKRCDAVCVRCPRESVCITEMVRNGECDLAKKWVRNALDAAEFIGAMNDLARAEFMRLSNLRPMQHSTQHCVKNRNDN